jgi:flagellar basal-body rod modification protein FlgD
MAGISGIAGIPTVEEKNPYAEKKTQALGRDDFLKMFMAQMKNQDPLNPMDTKDMSAQLAQFSSLEQLFNVNTNLEAMKASQDSSSRFQALDFIGKEILAEGTGLSLEEGKKATGNFQTESMANCYVVIASEDGLPVRRIPMGTLAAGSHSFEWDGLNDAGKTMEPGLYHFGITATNEKGRAVAVKTRVSGQVSGVNLDGSSVRLYVGDIPVTISDVVDIKMPSPAATGVTP